mgnify:CR=1 FL=1
MRRDKRIFLLVILLGWISAFASEVDETLKYSISRTPEAVAALDLPLSTEAERKLYWEGTEVNSNGFLSVEVPVQYLNTISLFASKRKLESGLTFEVKSRLFAGLNFYNLYRGEVVESVDRANFFFSFNAGLGMLTVWDLKSAGVRLVRFQEFLNADVNGFKGVLSIAKSVDAPSRALWKLNWVQKDMQFELYLEDGLDSGGRPFLLPNDILGLAEKVTKK